MTYLMLQIMSSPCGYLKSLTGVLRHLIILASQSDILHLSLPLSVLTLITHSPPPGKALLTIFQCTTLEGWSYIMYMYQDGYSVWFSALIFCWVVIVCAFFVINLMFAAMWEKFRQFSDLPGDSVSAARQVQNMPTLKPSLTLILTITHPGTQIEGFSSPCTSSLPTIRSKALTTAEGLPRQMLLNQCRDLPGNRPGLRSTPSALVGGNLFSSLILVCIVYNTVVLCLDSYPENPATVKFSEVSNIVLTVIFAIEMALHLVALGLRGYVQDPFNVFDGLIVLASLLELVLTLVGTAVLGNAITSLRFFRLMRVLKLAKSWESMRKIIGTIVSSLSETANVMVLLCLFVYIFSLLGMQLFATKFWFDVNGNAVPWEKVLGLSEEQLFLAGIYRPPTHFDDFVHALLATFAIITGEDWNLVMYDGIRGGDSMWFSLYFLVCVGLGQFIVLNLFLAILLSNFDSEHQPAESTGTVRMISERLKSVGRLTGLPSLITALHTAQAGSRIPSSPAPKIRDANTGKTHSKPGLTSPPAGHKLRSPTLCVEKVCLRLTNPSKIRPKKSRGQSGAVQPIGADEDAQEYSTEKRVKAVLHTVSSMKSTGSCLASVRVLHDILQDYQEILRTSFWRARKKSRRLVSSTRFEAFIMMLIAASSIALVLDNPLLDPNGKKAVVLGKLDLALTTLFTIEMGLKVFAFHVQYFNDGWNRLDALIVAISISSQVVILFDGEHSSSLSSLRALRAMRALRPLRLIHEAEGMRRVVSAMIKGLPSVANVGLVLSMFFMIFSIMGVSFFKGGFIGCDLKGSEEAILAAMRDFGLTKDTFVKYMHQADCEALGGKWGPTVHQNFDNVATGLLALFEISTSEGWVSVMNAGINSTGIDTNPVEEWRPANSLFFILFMIVGNFFAMNLFVGAVIDSYRAICGASNNSELFMSDAQKAWVEMQQMVRKAQLVPRPKPPKAEWRARVFYVAQHPNFERCMMASIAVNTIIMMVHHRNESEAITALLQFSSTVFSVIFTLELTVKIIAYGVRWPFKSSWNFFDTVIVIIADSAVVLRYTTGLDFQTLASTAQAARVMLLFRVVRGAKSLQTLIDTIISNLPGMLNISALLFLLIFCYAIVGMNLFATVMLQEELNEHANFQSFGSSFLTLFRMSTGEAWNTIMHELFLSEDCVINPSYGIMKQAWEETSNTSHMVGCGPDTGVTVIYFLSFNVLSAFMMLNVFIAIVVEAMSINAHLGDSSLTPSEFSLICEAWSELDPEASYLLPTQLLVKFLRSLPAPVGLMGSELNKAGVRKWIKDMGLTDYSGMLYFHEVVQAMTFKIVERNVYQALKDEKRREKFKTAQTAVQQEGEDRTMRRNTAAVHVVMHREVAEVAESALPLASRDSQKLIQRARELNLEEKKSGWDYQHHLCAEVIQSSWRTYLAQMHAHKLRKEEGAATGHMIFPCVAQ
ncbi:unnamed protein product [Chrysoparadoxa australica]